MLRHAQHERKKCCNDSRLIPFALSLSKGKRRVVEHAVMTHTPVALFLTIVLFCGVALAQDLTKAKQEEHIVFYTSWGPSDADYVIKAFEKKYPFLRVELARSSSEKTLNRLLTEQRANRFLGDVVAISGIQSGILKEKGLEFWRRLAEQQVNFRKGYTLITELLSAGEFPVTVSLYQHRVDEYIDKGAPVQWVAPNPLVGGDPNRIALLKNAPRPSAAKIFIDFMLSIEGQKLLQDRGRSPGRIGLGPKNPRLKGAKVFTFHVNSGEYEQLGKEFNKVSRFNNMALKLSMTCGPYDRARALIDGTVKPEGIDLEVYVNPDPGRQTKIEGREFDIAEFYSGLYIADLHYQSLGYTAIPIFVKRMFRHSYIYINKRAGIHSPGDLNGKRIGIQNWLTTTAVWARGLLEDEYGLDQKSVTWFTERMRGVGEWKPPAWLKMELIPSGRTQFDLLAAGEIDAGITTGTWAPNVHPNIDFLFPNYAELERDYFKRTGFFPIMHTLLIKTAVLEKDPWVAMSVYNAWQESKRKCYEWLAWQRVHQTSLWYRALWEEEQAVAGADFYLWGFHKTRPEVDKLLEYCHRQSLTTRKFDPEEMFHPSTLET